MKILKYSLILILVGCQIQNNKDKQDTLMIQELSINQSKEDAYRYLKEHFHPASGELAQGYSKDKSYDELSKIFDHLNLNDKTKGSLEISTWEFKNLLFKCYFYENKLLKIVVNNITVKNEIRYKELNSFNIQNYNEVLSNIISTGSKNSPTFKIPKS